MTESRNNSMQAQLPDNEAARLEALRQYQILDTAPEQAFEDLTLLATRICGTPIALVSLLDAERQWFKSKVGLEATQTPRNIAFCNYAILQPDIFIVPNTLADPRFATNPLVTSDPHIRFYVGVPLLTSAGYAIGTLCVIDRVPRKLSPQQVEGLQALSRQVMTQIELRHNLVNLVQANLARQESEERFRLLVQGVKDYAIFMLTADGRVASWNTGAERINGYRTKEIIGKHFSWFYPREDIERSKPELTLKVATALGEFEEEGWRIRKDGSRFWANVTITALRDADGNLRGFAKVTRDITERKRAESALQAAHAELETRVSQRTAELAQANEQLQTEIASRQQVEQELRASEARFRATFNSAAVGIAHVSLDGKWLLVNHKFCEIVGYSLQELQSLTFQQITHPNDLDVDLDNVRRLLANDIQTYSMEKRYIRKDTTYVWINLTVSLLRGQQGEPNYFISVVEDITERKQAAEQIQASLQEKEVLLKEIHHRVKNNLQIISSLLNLQSGELQNPQDLELLQVSQQRIAAMALIHEKLYQSPDLGRINFAEYIQDLVEGAFSSYEMNTDAVSLKLNIEPVVLDIDAAIPCGLIVNELVLNSLKHAFPAGKSGEIWIEFQTDSHKQIILNIGDNGIGFPEDLDFKNTTSLGLQLVNALTEQLEGTIELNKSSGVEFKITFPSVI